MGADIKIRFAEMILKEVKRNSPSQLSVAKKILNREIKFIHEELITELERQWLEIRNKKQIMKGKK